MSGNSLGDRPGSVPAAAVICIDGAGATGKGTLALGLARRLGWRLLDSGALYRTLAYAAEAQQLAATQFHDIAALAQGLDVAFQSGQQDLRVLLAGADVSADIRTEDCGRAASLIAASPLVRTALLQRQRDFCRPPGLVADGRDMGSVVFPDAGLKIFLTADARQRTARRYKQLNAQGIAVSLERLCLELRERDARDQQRAIAPLRPAADAVIIDTTDRAQDAVLQQAWDLYNSRLAR